MDDFICNKCYATTERAKKPYSLTQCGHVYCQVCARQAEKKCTQCNCVGAILVPLEQPLMPKISPYFDPLSQILDVLQKTCAFKANQVQILTRRFYEIDKKYEMLKQKYWNMIENAKVMTQKYYKLKAEKEECDKKLMFAQTYTTQLHNRRAPSIVFSDSQQSVNRFMHMPHSTLKSASVTPTHNLSIITPRTSDGFRIPRIPRSIGSSLRSTSDAS